MEKRRVVITGMGTVNPIGNSVADSWAAAKAGTCGIGPITRYDPSAQKARLAGEVKGLDLEGLLGKRECKKMDRFTQLALAASDQAMADSGLDREKADLTRCGVLFSSGIGGFETLGEAYQRGSARGFSVCSAQNLSAWGGQMLFWGGFSPAGPGRGRRSPLSESRRKGG